MTHPKDGAGKSDVFRVIQVDMGGGDDGGTGVGN